MIKYNSIILFIICAFTSFLEVNAQIITTIAGTGVGGYNGDNIAATLAEVNNPCGISIDIDGNIYIADYLNCRIRKIDTTGIITTKAGDGICGYSGDNNIATNAQINLPSYLFVSLHNNSVYISDFENGRIRLLNSSNIISAIAGNGSSILSGDEGVATVAGIMGPSGIKIDKKGNIFFCDDYCRIRRIDTLGIIHTVAGTVPGYGGDNGAATNAQLFLPIDLAFDKNGNLLFTDGGNNRVRKIDTFGTITTIAGNGIAGYYGDNGAATLAEVNFLEGIVIDNNNNIFISDVGNNRVRKIDSNGKITTMVGNGFAGFGGDNGPATAALLNAPTGLTFDKYGNLYITDYYNNRIRKVTNVGVMVNEVKEVVQEKSEYLVYPNPASKTVTIDGVIGCEVAMYDMLGNEKWKGRSEKSKVVIDVSGWVNGVYILEITDVGTGERVVKRVVKE